MKVRRALIAGLASLQGCVTYAATLPREARMEEASEHKGSGVRVTRIDGTPIYINPRVVAFVRAPLPEEEGNAVIVFTTGAKQQVIETVDEVIDAIHKDMPGSDEGP